VANKKERTIGQSGANAAVAAIIMGKDVDEAIRIGWIVSGTLGVLMVDDDTAKALVEIKRRLSYM
jgi:hypothetical protein